jgi:hypothetical protein
MAEITWEQIIEKINDDNYLYRVIYEHSKNDSPISYFEDYKFITLFKQDFVLCYSLATRKKMITLLNKIIRCINDLLETKKISIKKILSKDILFPHEVN